MKRFAIIVAGGTGQRFGSDIPKQFHLLAGRPVLMHAIEKFSGLADEIILVLAASNFDSWSSLCSKHDFHIPHSMAEGGPSRTQSVRSGIKRILHENGVVAIHDAARPLVSRPLIEKLFTSAARQGNAVPAISVADAIRHADGSRSISVDRNLFRLIQTPQVFMLEQFRKAIELVNNLDFPDDASWIEHAGFEIFLEEGESVNIKITTPADLIFAEAWLKNNPTH